MKKKVLIGAGIAVVIIMVAILLFRIKKSASASDNNGIDEVKATWSVENYVKGEDKASSVVDNAKEIDTDPNSITVLVNKQYSIDKAYKPSDLVIPDIQFSFNYKDEKKYLRKEAAKNLELLFQGAKYFGYELLGVSGYRSYDRQKTLYEYSLLNNGFDYTQVYSAMPGTSEHQTGLAIDISCTKLNGLLTDKFGETKEGKWVYENCYKYGFIVRYPGNKSGVTGYGYEPWHIRYVGYDLAKFLHDKNITLDEYYEYKVNQDEVDRVAYAYYDDLLTRKSAGKAVLSKAELDDVIDKKNIQMSNGVNNKKVDTNKTNNKNNNSTTSTKKPAEIIGKPDDNKGDDENSKPNITETEQPKITQAPTHTATPTPTVSPTSPAIDDEEDDPDKED